MADESEIVYIGMVGGDSADRLAVSARAAQTVWGLVGACFADVRLTAVPVDPTGQVAALRDAGFDVELPRRRMRFFCDDVQARAAATSIAQLKRLLLAGDWHADVVLRQDVEFEAMDGRRRRLTISNLTNDSIALSAGGDALREQILNRILLELVPFATERLVYLERREAGRC